MKYEIVSAGSPQGLTKKINECIAEGWKPIGSHTVVTERSINRYAGQQHMDTRHDVEYAQTMVMFDDEQKYQTDILSSTPSGLDIRDVADDLNITLIEGMIEFVQQNFNAEVSNDPTATWDLIVENLLYQYVNDMKA